MLVQTAIQCHHFFWVIAYHSSRNYFERFDPQFIGANTGWGGPATGFYFSLDPRQASHVAEGYEDDQWWLYTVRLRVENPAYAANYDETFDRWGDEEEARDALVASGYDSLIIADGEEIIVFDPDKIEIKSVQSLDWAAV